MLLSLVRHMFGFSSLVPNVVLLCGLLVLDMILSEKQQAALCSLCHIWHFKDILLKIGVLGLQMLISIAYCWHSISLYLKSPTSNMSQSYQISHLISFCFRVSAVNVEVWVIHSVMCCIRSGSVTAEVGELYSDWCYVCQPQMLIITLRYQLGCDLSFLSGYSAPHRPIAEGTNER